MPFINLKKYLNGLSLQKKLILINLSVTATALLFSVIMALGSEYIDNRNDILESLQVQSKIVASNTAAALIFEDAEDAQETLEAFSASPDIQVAVIFDNKNAPLAIYTRHGAEVSDRLDLMVEKYKTLEVVVSDLSNHNFFLDDQINFIQNINFDNEKIGHLFVSADISHLKEYIISYLIYIIFMALIGLGLASLLLLKLKNSITRPIFNLSKVMNTVIEKNDYSLRVNNSSTDEIGTLSLYFNNMLAHIQLNDKKLAHELSERYKAEEHLDKLAYYDLTTNLPNRHFFQKHLKNAVDIANSTSQKMVLLFLDLDNFKTVNDTLGHKVGDILLEQASSRLSNILRQNDHICRIGGDEFAIVIQGFDNLNNVSLIAQKCIDALSSPFVFEENKFFIGVSIGISICPDDATTANDLLVNADMAMYEAKLLGKNNFQFYSKKMNEAYSRKYQLANDLRRAVELNQLELYYQPQVDAKKEKIIGAEALMRWHHPEKGMIPPDEFIPLAEESSLILSIGQWLIETACLQGQQIIDSGLNDITIAINISGVQIKDDDFYDIVSHALEESRFDPRKLEIELTESVLMDSTDLVIKKLKQLRLLGVSIAIDDFGTGYSSMNYLKVFPIGKLKIDKSFVFGLPESDEDTAITRAIIAMAHGLKLKVIAEGVEDQHQAEFLREQGCDAFQGYYYSRPLSFSDFLELKDKLKSSNSGLSLLKVKSNR